MNNNGDIIEQSKKLAQLLRGSEGMTPERVDTLLSTFFTPRQKEIILKRAVGESLNRFETNYYSTVIKKRLSALADPMVHKFTEIYYLLNKV